MKCFHLFLNLCQISKMEKMEKWRCLWYFFNNPTMVHFFALLPVRHHQCHVLYIKGTVYPESIKTSGQLLLMHEIPGTDTHLHILCKQTHIKDTRIHKVIICTLFLFFLNSFSNQKKRDTGNTGIILIIQFLHILWKIDNNNVFQICIDIRHNYFIIIFAIIRYGW